MTDEKPTQEDLDRVGKALDNFGKDVSEGFNNLAGAARNMFKCWKCGKEIDPKGVVIVDQLNGFIHEECQGEYKGQ